MKLEIEFADDIDAKELRGFLESLSQFSLHWKYLFKEIRIVREPKHGRE